MKIKDSIQSMFSKFEYIKLQQLKFLVDDIEHMLHLRIDLTLESATYLYILLQSLISSLYLEIYKHLEYGQIIVDKKTKQKKRPTDFRSSIKLLILYEKLNSNDVNLKQLTELKNRIDKFVSSNQDNIRYLKTIRNDLIAHDSTHFSNDHFFIMDQFKSRDIFYRPYNIVKFIDESIELICQCYTDIHKIYKSRAVRKTKKDYSFYEMGYEMLEFLVNKYSTDENSKL